MRKLIEAIERRNVILFIGAGVSANMGIPALPELVRRLADDLGVEAESFQESGDFRSLAEYYALEKDDLSALRRWMDPADERDTRHSPIHQRIVKLDVPLIYTTNYDRLLETAFEQAGAEFHRIANVSDIAGARDGVTQLVKLHGDIRDGPIVLTESNFFDRLSFESPLDLKLRADVLGRTILFIGYSLSDINIRYLLYKLHKQWKDSEFEHARPRSYMYFPNPNPVQERILQSRGIEPIVDHGDDAEHGLARFLDKLLMRRDTH